MLENDAARKILLSSDTFYIGQDGLLYHLDQNRKRRNHEAFSQRVIPHALKFEICQTSMIIFQVLILEYTKPFRRLSKGTGGKACSKILSTGASPARFAQRGKHLEVLRELRHFLYLSEMHLIV